MSESLEGNQTGATFTLWVLFVLYAAARAVQIFPGRFSLVAVVALHVLPPIVFASSPWAHSRLGHGHRW